MDYTIQKVAARAYVGGVRNAYPGIPDIGLIWRFVGKLMEEAGEVQKAYNQFIGMSHHKIPDTDEAIAEELADTVICAYGLAMILNIDLDMEIEKKNSKNNSIRIEGDGK